MSRWGAASRDFRGYFYLSCLFISLIFSSCDSSSSSPAAIAPAPETQAQESVKNIGTLIAQATAGMMGMPESYQGKAQSQGWFCPEEISYENDCLKLTGSCSAAGPQVTINGTAEFKKCLQETALGLAVISGSLAFTAAWDLPPSCVLAAPNPACLSALITLNLSNPSQLVIRFGELEPMGISALQAFLEERWRLAGFGMWRMVLQQWSATSEGNVFQCSGDPVTCTVTAVVPVIPPAVDPVCLKLPDCESDEACAEFLSACPDTADLLADFGHELRCLESESRPGRSCRPVKIPVDEGPVTGECARTPAGWTDWCPMSFNTTVNGDGVDCTGDANCQTRTFATFYGNSPCNAPCFNCQFHGFDCEACDACLPQLLCVRGCCAVDEDLDGFVTAGGNFGDDPLIQMEREDNCNLLFNPDQSDVDLDCLGDLCDNCPAVVNGYGSPVGQSDLDYDEVGDACDNCLIVKNGALPVISCNLVCTPYPCEKGYCETCETICEELPSLDNQLDTDGDGIGNACEGDYDGDGVPDELDNCPRTIIYFRDNPASQSDIDSDGLGDICDNCARTFNPDQKDVTDELGNPIPNGRGDACDHDLDEDGFSNGTDNCPDYFNPDQNSRDEDPFGDACDICPDDYTTENQTFACQEPDFDGVPNLEDNCPNRYNPEQEPFGDREGYPGQACSYCLISESPSGKDEDADGFIDTWDCDNCVFIANPNQDDSDGDLIGDFCDNCRFVRNWGQRDSDFDGVGDACAFCDQDGTCGEAENFFNCPADCPAACGNGVTENPLESCDDGNLTDGDGCDSNCTATGCGNGVITAGEVCGESGAPGCADGLNCRDCACAIPFCGDGFVDPGESCDDGNTDSNDDCTDTCAPNICGDGILNPAAEQCDSDDSVCQGSLPGTAPHYCHDTECRCVGFCGDRICDPARETVENCYNDCSSCGDGICEFSESVVGCEDCADMGASCHNKICDAGETIFSCWDDCRTGCGDGFCLDREVPSTCYGDCRHCGDGFCDSTQGEDAATCPEDFCGQSAEPCGDGTCNVKGGETLRNCFADCSSCGDFFCDTTRESFDTCPDDCGGRPPPK